MARSAEAFAELLRRWTAAESSGDTATVAELLDHDFRGDDAPGYVLDKGQWLERHHSCTGTGTRFEWCWSEPEVLDGVAVARGRYRRLSGDHGTVGPVEFRATVIARYRSDSWSIVSIQLSRHDPTPSREPTGR